MAKLRDLDLERFVAYVERRPTRLGCWRDGKVASYPTLAWLNVKPVVEQRLLAQKVGYRSAVGLTTSAHHNQVGIAAAWVSRYMVGPTRPVPTPSQDRRALWHAADQYWSLSNLIIEIRAGVRDYVCEGTRVSLPYRGNNEVDALDRMLDLVEQLDSMEPPRVERHPRHVDWISSEGKTSPWQRVPPWAKDTYRQLADTVLTSYPTYLPPDVQIAGFKVRDLDAYWRELMAWGMHMNAAILWGSEHPPTTVPLQRRDRFIDTIASGAEMTLEAADRITTVSTMDIDRSPDPALTPLVPLADDLIPMSSLIMPGSPHRNTLAIVQADPHLYGEAGRLLGIAGEHATLNTLERLSTSTLKATRVKAVRKDGSPAGDLDVVVCDPNNRILVIFEIKWHIAADGNAEVYRMERAALGKRDQVLRLRREIESGTAQLRWPHNWPDVSDYTWRWFVLTRDVLAARNVATDDITLRSHQLLARMLRRDSTVQDLVNLLDNPPIPPAELLATEWHRIRYGDLRIDIESIIA